MTDESSLFNRDCRYFFFLSLPPSLLHEAKPKIDEVLVRLLSHTHILSVFQRNPYREKESHITQEMHTHWSTLQTSDCWQLQDKLTAARIRENDGETRKSLLFSNTVDPESEYTAERTIGHASCAPLRTLVPVNSI